MSLFKILKSVDKLAKSSQFNKIDPEFLNAENSDKVIPKSKRDKAEKQLLDGKIDPKHLDQMINNRNFNIAEILLSRGDLSKEDAKRLLGNPKEFRLAYGNRNRQQEVHRFYSNLIRKLHSYDGEDDPIKNMIAAGDDISMGRVNKYDPSHITGQHLYNLFSNHMDKFSPEILSSLVQHKNFGPEHAVEVINRSENPELMHDALRRSVRNIDDAGQSRLYNAALSRNNDELNRLMTDTRQEIPRDVQLKILENNQDPETIGNVLRNTQKPEVAEYVLNNFDKFANMPKYASRWGRRFGDDEDKEYNEHPLKDMLSNHKAINPDLADRLYDHFAGQGNIDVLHDQNFDRINQLHPHTLQKILDLPDEVGGKLKESIATHDSLTDELRAKLANTSNDYDVLSEALKAEENPDKLREIYNKITSLHGPEVVGERGYRGLEAKDHARNLLDNSATPNDVLKDLLTHSLVASDAEKAAGIKPGRGRWDHGSTAEKLVGKAMQHKSVSPDMIDTVLSSQNPHVRLQSHHAHEVATDDQITKALSDKNKEVRAPWADKPNLKPEHVNMVANDRVKDIAIKALSHQGATPKMLDDAMKKFATFKNDTDYDAVSKLSKNPSLSEGSVVHALKGLGQSEVDGWRKSRILEELTNHRNLTDEGLRSAILSSKDGRHIGQILGARDRMVGSEPLHAIYDHISSLKDPGLAPYGVIRHAKGLDSQSAVEMTKKFAERSEADDFNSYLNNVLENNSIQPEHLREIYDIAETRPGIAKFKNFAKHPQFGASGLADDIINQTGGKGPNDLMRLLEHSEGLTPEQIDTVIDQHKDSAMRPYLMNLHKQKNLKSHHIDKIMNDLADFDKMKYSQMEWGSDGEDDARYDAQNHSEQIEKFLHHPSFTSEMGDKLYHKAHSTGNDDLAYHLLDADKLSVDNIKHSAKHFPDSRGIQRLIEDRLSHHDPNAYNETLGGHDIEIHPAIEKLKHLKGIVEEAGGGIHKKDLPKNFQNIPGQLLDGKGMLTADSIEKYIGELPKHKYNVSYDKWEAGNAQMHDSDVDQSVYQFNLTNDHVKQLKDEGVWDDFKEMHKQSHMSGHPVRKHSIGWARVDESHPGHAHIDEVQSDFGQNTIRQIEHMKKQGHDIPQQKIDNYKKVMKILAGPFKSINHMILNGTHQVARNKGFTSTSMDTIEDQAKQSGMSTDRSLPGHMQHTYKQLPNELGYSEAPKKQHMPNTTAEEPNIQYRKLVKSLQIIGELLKIKNS